MVNPDIVTFKSEEHNNGLVESIAGMLIEIEDGRPHITLMEIAENVGEKLMENLPLAVQAVRDQFFPELGLEDIDWTARAGAVETDIDFTTSNGSPIQMTLSNGGRMTLGSAQPLESYAVPRDESAPRLTSHDLTFYIVPQPDNPNGESTFVSGFDAPHIRDSKTVVMLDAGLFLEHWRQQAGFSEERAAELRAEGFTDTKNDMILLSSSREESARHAVRQDANGTATEMAEVTYNPANRDEPIAIDNGRHRIFHAINLGAPYIPVVMPNDENTRMFAERFSWSPDRSAERGLDMALTAGT